MSVLNEIFQETSAIVEETFDIIRNNRTNLTVLIHDYLANMDLPNTTTAAPVPFPGDHWSIVIVVFVALLAFTALIVHAGIFLGTFLSPLPITGYDVLIANMCLINMGILVLVAPEALTVSLVYLNKWPMGAKFCHAWNFFRAFYTVASGWNLTVLSIHQMVALILLISPWRPFGDLSGNVVTLLWKIGKLFLPVIVVWIVSCGVEVTFVEIEPQLYMEICTIGGDTNGGSLEKFILAEQIVSFWIPTVVSVLTLICALIVLSALWRSRLAEAFKVRQRSLQRVLYSRRSWQSYGDYDTSNLLNEDDVPEPHGHLALNTEEADTVVRGSNAADGLSPQSDSGDVSEEREITKQSLLMWGILVAVHFVCIVSLYILFLTDFHNYLETTGQITVYFRVTLCVWAVKFLLFDPLTLVAATDRYRTKIVTACRRLSGRTNRPQ